MWNKNKRKILIAANLLVITALVVWLVVKRDADPELIANLDSNGTNLLKSSTGSASLNSISSKEVEPVLTKEADSFKTELLSAQRESMARDRAEYTEIRLESGRRNQTSTDEEVKATLKQMKEDENSEQI